MASNHEGGQPMASTNHTGGNDDDGSRLNEPNPGGSTTTTSDTDTHSTSVTPPPDAQSVHGPSAPVINPNHETSSSGIRQRIGANPAPAAAETVQPRPDETPQERRRRRLQRDREQLLSLINANPVTCLLILVGAAFVVVGFGYFLYELHLAYKYSSIIHKLHISSLKDGYGGRPSFSSSQKAHPGKVKPPSPSLAAPAETPKVPEVQKLPMLDAETEMYANQLQSVLSGLKRTLNRIDPGSNSSTMMAGIVELKPAGTKEEERAFTTEVNSEDAKSNSRNTSPNPNDDLYSFLTRGLGKNAKAIPDQKPLHQPTQKENFAQNPKQEQQSFPNYLHDLKTSLEAETKKAEDKLNDWIEKHRHEYDNEDDWNEALALKKAKEDDYNRFLDAMFYVAEELENDYSEGGVGSVDSENDDDSVTLGKLLEILAKSARSNDDDEDIEKYYSGEVSGDKYGKAEVIGRDTSKKADADYDWPWDAWEDEDEDGDDWDDHDKAEQERRRTAPQFA